MALLRRENQDVESFDVFGRFDRLFDEWSRMLPFRGESPRWPSADEVIRVDEYRDGDTLVIRAELPGMDPESDVDLSVADGMLHLTAERRTEEKREAEGYLRRELRYGTFSRTLPLPEGVSEADIDATCRDGILEVRIPVPQAVAAKEPKKITVKRG